MGALEFQGGSIVYAFHAVADPGRASVGGTMLAQGTRVVPLVYDALAFGKTTLPTAIGAAYVDALQSAGMESQVMAASVGKEESR